MNIMSYGTVDLKIGRFTSDPDLIIQPLKNKTEKSERPKA